MDGAIVAGSLVRVMGLAGRLDLNGQECQVVSFDEDKQRFAVRVCVGSHGEETPPVLIKAANLELVDAGDAERFHKAQRSRAAACEAAIVAPAAASPPPMCFHDAVVVQGLQAKPHFNEQLGIIIGWTPGTGRFTVLTAECGTLSLKPANCKPAVLDAVEGTDLLEQYPVVQGDSDFGGCSICEDNQLTLVSPWLSCCGQSMCNDCAIALSSSDATAQGTHTRALTHTNTQDNTHTHTCLPTHAYTHTHHTCSQMHAYMQTHNLNENPVTHTMHTLQLAATHCNTLQHTATRTHSPTHRTRKPTHSSHTPAV